MRYDFNVMILFFREELTVVQQYESYIYRWFMQIQETLDVFSKLVLYEMVSINENYGKRPEGYIENIN
jgi:hypothetical protein